MVGSPGWLDPRLGIVTVFSLKPNIPFALIVAVAAQAVQGLTPMSHNDRPLAARWNRAISWSDVAAESGNRWHLKASECGPAVVTRDGPAVAVIVGVQDSVTCQPSSLCVRWSMRLLAAISGRGAFRRFKDVIHRHGVQEAWYAFRTTALEEDAAMWLEAHGIVYGP